MTSTKDTLRSLQATGHEVQFGHNLYDVNRGLETKHFADSYLKDLPTFEGKNVVDILDSAIGEPDFAILDVGVGEGNFLAEVSEKYGNAFKYDGITTYPYHDTQRMNEHKVNVEVLDVQRMYRRKKYNLIVAEQALQYTENPLLALKRIYSALKPGGVALISPLVVEFKYFDHWKSFIQFLEKEYHFEPSLNSHSHLRVAFTKTKENFSLPVSIVGSKDLSNPWVHIEQALYTFHFPQS